MLALHTVIDDAIKRIICVVAWFFSDKIKERV
jgi:hypothetical protein